MFESNIVPTVLTTIRYRHYIYWNDQWYRKQFFFFTKLHVFDTLYV